MPMSELLLVGLAFILLIAGVVGSILPQVPGAVFSIAGVLTYWVGPANTEPTTVVLVALLVVGFLTLVTDWVAGAVAAKVGGASTTTALIAGVVGFALFLVTGPLGIIAGVAGTVFLLELWRQDDAVAGGKAALVTTAGMLGSTVVQVVLTGSMLLVVALVALT
jgi:uncharacterized protein YqgC (DUF456 family)